MQDPTPLPLAFLAPEPVRANVALQAGFPDPASATLARATIAAGISFLPLARLPWRSRCSY